MNRDYYDYNSYGSSPPASMVVPLVESAPPLVVQAVGLPPIAYLAALGLVVYFSAGSLVGLLTTIVYLPFKALRYQLFPAALFLAAAELASVATTQGRGNSWALDFAACCVATIIYMNVLVCAWILCAPAHVIVPASGWTLQNGGLAYGYLSIMGRLGGVIPAIRQYIWSKYWTLDYLPRDQRGPLIDTLSTYIEAVMMHEIVPGENPLKNLPSPPPHRERRDPPSQHVPYPTSNEQQQHLNHMGHRTPSPTPPMFINNNQRERRPRSLSRRTRHGDLGPLTTADGLHIPPAGSPVRYDGDFSKPRRMRSNSRLNSARSMSPPSTRSIAEFTTLTSSENDDSYYEDDSASYVSGGSTQAYGSLPNRFQSPRRVISDPNNPRDPVHQMFDSQRKHNHPHLSKLKDLIN